MHWSLMVHRSRRRYVVLHILSPEDAGKGLLIKLTRDRTRNLSKEEFDIVKPWFVYFHKGWAIIRTSHLGLDMMKEILGSLNDTKLRDGTFRLRIVAVAGTLRSAYMKHIPEKARSDHHYREEWKKT